MIPKSTVNWRIWELVKVGILERVGRGLFIRGKTIQFRPFIRNQLKRLDDKIKAQYPFLKYCLWENDMIRTFQQHLSGSRFILIDVDKDGVEALFEFLRETNKHTWIRPGPDMMYKYVLQQNDSIIVRRLISQAPVQFSGKTQTVTIEKMLVDVFADGEFNYLAGNELSLVFKTAYERFTVNQNKLLRYAGRKGQREKLHAFLQTNQLTKKVYTANDIPGNTQR
jgi:hypothetical protein